MTNQNTLPIRCLICSKPLVPLKKGGFYELWKGLFHDGDAWEIRCSFGSRFDTEKFVFSLCDKCIQDKIDAKLLIPNGNIREDLPPREGYFEELRRSLREEDEVA